MAADYLFMLRTCNDINSRHATGAFVPSVSPSAIATDPLYILHNRSAATAQLGMRVRSIALPPCHVAIGVLADHKGNR
jgi:hypothetical protein